METAIIKKLGYRAREKLKSARALVPVPRPSDADFLRELNLPDAASLLDSFPQIFPGCRHQENLRLLRKGHPDACRRVELHARSSAEHVFDLLGSGPVNLGVEIDWSLDFKSGKQWDKRDYRMQKLVDLRDNSDVKVPWELSRCNHFLPMAVAYLITDDDLYPIEYENQIQSWCDGNAYERGINWTCAMETAFRCINWLLAYQLFSIRRSFSHDFRTRLAVELYKAGKHIKGNLESIGAGFNSNHYLADLVGLLYLGELFKAIPRGREWRVFAVRELEKEVELQIGADGLDYESSLPYHGLVTEILLYAYLLSQLSDFNFSRAFADKLRLMLQNLSLFTQGDGTLLPFGDSDDGRLVKMFCRHPRDFRDLIAIGKALFGVSGGNAGESAPETLMLFATTDSLDTVATTTAQTPTSVFLKDSGICRLRSEDLDLTFFVNPVGTAGLGNHKHNDILSFTLAYRGKPIFIDVGSYVYTASEEWRNTFRSTACHNTITIDGYEQNRMVDGLLFLLRHDSHPKVVLWKSDALSDLVVAEHDGYRRLDDPVLHRRSVFLCKRTQVVLIRDELLAKGSHRIEFNFHLENLKLDLLPDGALHLRPDEQEVGVLFTECDAETPLTLTTNWVSPSYGVKYAGIKLTKAIDRALPVTALFAITPVVHDGPLRALQRIRQARQKIQW